MIEASDAVFPNNFVLLIADRFEMLDADLMVFKRPLRESDPNQCVGVFATLWTPDDQSMEMRGPASGMHEPTIEAYSVGIQGFIKDTDTERGLNVHSVLSEMIRSMLYRDAPLRVALSSLTTDLLGVHKRVQGWGIRNQRYFSNELSGAWVFLSTVECWLEVETVPS